MILSIEALERALDDAGGDPGDFDSGKPPEGVSKEEQEAIARAADEVGSRETEVALAAQAAGARRLKAQLWL